MLIATFDGSCQWKSGGGRGGYGLHVTTETGRPIHADYGALPRCSANTAELVGLVETLRWIDGVMDAANIWSDSRIIVNAVNQRGVAVSKGMSHARELILEARLLLKANQSTLQWRGREHNAIADALAALGRESGLVWPEWEKAAGDDRWNRKGDALKAPAHREYYSGKAKRAREYGVERSLCMNVGKPARSVVSRAVPLPSNLRRIAAEGDEE